MAPSIVWAIMEKVDDSTVQCRLCGARFTYHRSTTTLLRHLHTRHPEYAKADASSVKKLTTPDAPYSEDNDSSALPLKVTPNFSIDTSDEESAPSDGYDAEKDYDPITGKCFVSQSKKFKRARTFQTVGFKHRKANYRGFSDQKSLFFKRRTTSMVWRFMNKEGPFKSSCKICKKTFHVQSQATTSMLKHLRAFHPETIEKYDDDEWVAGLLTKSNALPSSSSHKGSLVKSTQSPPLNQTESASAIHTNLSSNHVLIDSSPGKETKITTPSKNSLYQYRFISMIVSDLQPCSIVENAGFRNLMKIFNPKVVVPNQKIIEEDILELHQKHLNMLQEQIDETPGISVTTDIWHYRQGQQYMTVSGHFISKTWELQSVVLKTVLLDSQSDLNLSASIAQMLGHILKDWKIENKVTCIITDNTEPLAKAVMLLNKPHLKCIAHAINYMVQESLKSAPDINYLAKKVRYISNLFHHNVEASEKLCAVQTSQDKVPLKFLRDSESEWISTYNMFQRYQDLHEYILYLVAEETIDGSIPLVTEELDLLSRFTLILNPIALAVGEIATEGYPSLAKSLPVFEILHQMMAGQVKICSDSSLPEKDSVAALARELFVQIDQILTTDVRNKANLLCFAATLLDPRFKSIVLKEEDVLKCVEDKLQQQMETQSGENEDQNIKMNFSTGESKSDNQSSLLWSSFDATVKLSVKEKPVNELHRYIEESSVARHESSLQFWKDREPLYPKLCNVVKKYLSIPATSVPSNQVFSEEEKKKISRRTFLEESSLDSILFLSSCPSVIHSTVS